MKILGIHKGHDSSAAAVVEGKVVADVQEERFNRVKHSADLPINSILYCMDKVGVSDINEFDKITLSWRRTPRDVSTLFGLPNEKIASWKDAAIKLGRSIVRRADPVPPIYIPEMTIKDNNRFVTKEHHEMHAASAHFTRDSSTRCLVFTVDGSGDGVATAVWVAEGSKIEPLCKLNGSDAGIGWAYSIVTEGLHWIHGDGEGKTMGLAPYGDPNICRGMLDSLFPRFKGTRLVKSSDVGPHNSFMLCGSNHFHFEYAKYVETLAKEYGRENVAAEAQRKLEEVLLSYILSWCEKTGIRTVAAAGGVFLNVKLNQRIWEQRGNLIDNYYVYPNPGDSGLAVGGALDEYYKHHPFYGGKLEHLYLGPEYDDKDIERALSITKMPYQKVSNAPQKAAEALAKGKIVAWYQGRMESGPRALGNRSILMSPLDSQNKDTINSYVKFREGFRPFCPSLLHEVADKYLKDYREELFMITSYDVTDEKHDVVPAVVHADRTLRPQMVRKDLNPRYWKLINEFGKLTGESIVLNTSYNIMGEPIVNTPEEAIRGFYASGIDVLFMGDYMATKVI